jgi:transcription initiation factor TFIIE subunit alpha
MQAELLSEIIEDVAGKKAVELLEVIVGKEDVNEFLIAKKLNLTINQVRNILYKLSDYNLVSFIRKKDKKKGWYTYFWTLNERKTLELLDKKLEKDISKLKGELDSREKNSYYICKVCKREVSESEALDDDFICPECGEVYNLQESKKVFKNLKKEIKKKKEKRKKVLKKLSKRKKEEKKEKKEKRRKRRVPIDKIKGIGKKKAEKFKKKRITTAKALLRLKPETIAKKVSISVKSAKKYQKRAEKKLR